MAAAAAAAATSAPAPAPVPATALAEDTATAVAAATKPEVESKPASTNSTPPSSVSTPASTPSPTPSSTSNPSPSPTPPAPPALSAPAPDGAIPPSPMPAASPPVVALTTSGEAAFLLPALAAPQIWSSKMRDVLDDLSDGQFSRDGKTFSAHWDAIEKYKSQPPAQRDLSLLDPILPEEGGLPIQQHQLPTHGSASMMMLAGQVEEDLQDMNASQAATIKSYNDWLAKGQALESAPSAEAAQAKKDAIESMVKKNQVVEKVASSGNREILKTLTGATLQTLKEMGPEEVKKRGHELKAEKQNDRTETAFANSQTFSQDVADNAVLNHAKKAEDLQVRSYDRQKGFAQQQVDCIVNLDKARNENLEELSTKQDESAKTSKDAMEAFKEAEAAFEAEICVFLTRQKAYFQKMAQALRAAEGEARLAEMGTRALTDKALSDEYRDKALETCHELAVNAGRFEEEGRRHRVQVIRTLTQHHQANFDDLSELLGYSGGWCLNSERHYETKKAALEARLADLKAKQEQAKAEGDEDTAEEIEEELIPPIEESISKTEQELAKVAQCQQEQEEQRLSAKKFLEYTPEALAAFEETLKEKTAETDGHFHKAIWTEDSSTRQPGQPSQQAASASAGPAATGSAIVSSDGNKASAIFAKLASDLAKEKEQNQMLKQGYVELKMSNEKMQQEIAELRAHLPTIGEHQQLQSQAPSDSLLQQHASAPAPMPRSPSTESLSTVSSAWVDVGEEDTTRPSASTRAPSSVCQ